MNLTDIEQERIARLSKQEKELLEQLMSKSSICFKAEPRADKKVDPDSNSSRLGGRVLLPEALEHPRDRSGAAQLLIAQIDLKSLPSEIEPYKNSGILLVFCNKEKNFTNQKDRRSFACIWIDDVQRMQMQSSQEPNASISPESAYFLDFQTAFSFPAYQQAYQFEIEQAVLDKLSGLMHPQKTLQIGGQGGRRFCQLQEIAAFAANGVSWSPARSNDSCFSHLKEAASQWQVLLRIDSFPEFNLDLGSNSLYLLIRKEDRLENRFERSWLLLG